MAFFDFVLFSEDIFLNISFENLNIDETYRPYCIINNNNNNKKDKNVPFEWYCVFLCYDIQAHDKCPNTSGFYSRLKTCLKIAFGTTYRICDKTYEKRLTYVAICWLSNICT